MYAFLFLTHRNHYIYICYFIKQVFYKTMIFFGGQVNVNAT